jgi:FlaA1/EpsC-like NDP-sugar epimerase
VPEGPRRPSILRSSIRDLSLERVKTRNQTDEPPLAGQADDVSLGTSSRQIQEGANAGASNSEIEADFGGLLRRYRRLLEPTTDCLGWVASLVVATELRYAFQSSRAITIGLLWVSLIAVATQVAFGSITSLYRVRWKNASFEQVVVLATTIASVTTSLLIINVVAFRHAIPVGAVVGAGAFTFVGATGLRGWWRMIHEYRIQRHGSAGRAIVFGAGDGGKQVIDVLLTRESPFTPVALLDDDPRRANTRLRHLRVAGGRAQLSQVASAVRANVLIVAIPSAASTLIRELSDLARLANLELRVLPSVSELLAEPSLKLSNIRTVTEVDLMGRHTIETNVGSIAEYLTGSRVLVTGAGGSIGSELCCQINGHSPGSLIMLDASDSGLHQVQLAMEGAAPLDSPNLIVADIRDAARVNAIFDEYQPEIVFHAAALKHLSLLEMWPGEAIKTNVVGTWNVLRACSRSGVKRFVNISTDKAADPISVLGYSKRIGERLTATMSTRATGAYLSVRFGNVLGSRGSALVTFRTQIEAGQPITLTHPDVTRFFMTVREAVQLVIQAGAIGETGEVLILDMGDPVRIAEVARRLAGDGVEVTFTGLRPGEKLHEVLLGAGEVDVRPRHPQISQVRVPPMCGQFIDELMDSSFIGSASDAVVIRRMLKAISNSPAMGTEQTKAGEGPQLIPAIATSGD